MYSKIIIHILLIAILSAAQISFISRMPAGLNHLNLILIVLVFILGLISFESSMIWAVGTGALLDIFSFFPFGVHLFCLFAAMVIINILLVNFFTDRSLYSFLALAGIATIIYEIFLRLINYLMQIFSSSFIAPGGVIFLKALIYQLAYNIICAFIIFYAAHYINKNLRPVFLLKK